MIRYKVSKGMRILFVGINPHPGSYRRGVPFSNNKMFWYLLSRSGCIMEDIEELREDHKLKHMYNTKFNRVYKYGFLNVINRPTIDVSMLVPGEENIGKRKIMKSIQKHKPKVVCFIGKVTYEKFTGTKDFKFGWQDDIFSSKSFVMRFPLRGRATVRIMDLKQILRNL